ncbi:MAG TPA: phosphopantetheine-binding protein, partial [Ktedonobacterales bacterium]|nr:phosphopantetheine-binding protein [Ktedonobacterales bacterium]
PGDQRIIAYITASDPAPLPDDLRRHLQSRLPTYMVPAAFAVLPSFPLTPNGKVDRRQLPKSESTLDDGDTYIAPRTPEEIALADIWSDILGATRIGVNDNFFALGGHSLLATRVIARIRDAFRSDVTLRTLFESPTVASLAIAVAEAKKTPKAPLVPITRNARRQHADSQT